MLQLQEIYETEITGYTSDGRGVARIDGCVVFVPNTIAGERCRVRILYIGKHGATGKIESILEKSPHRIPRACPNAKLCGGCCFWHMDYEEECRLKAQRVRDALQRIGGYDPGEVPITGGGTAWHYRNKAHISRWPSCGDAQRLDFFARERIRSFQSRPADPAPGGGSGKGGGAGLYAPLPGAAV